MQLFKLTVGFVVLAAMAATTLGVTRNDAVAAADHLRSTTTQFTSSPRVLDTEERSNVSVFRQASPSVVHIVTKTAVARRRGNVTLDIESISSGSGSGFIWDREGHIVTNYHVVREADAAQVILSDGRSLKARLVGAAPQFDIAVLKVSASAGELIPLRIGQSHDLEVGQKVYAIGNPFGLDHTLTSGIVSGLGREIQSQSGTAIQDVIQTDAAINPGNSGGPLLDSQGALIGVNTAIISRSGASAGVGFAVPVNAVRSAVPQLISKGSMSRPSLGVALAPRQINERFEDSGILILRVVEGGPAAQADLRSTQFDQDGNVVLGDFIVSINGTRTETANDLRNELSKHSFGDIVALGIKRGPEFGRVEVTLGGTR